MDSKKKSTTREERIEIWSDLVRDVASQLPVPTKRDVIKLCLEAFDKNGYKDEYDNTFFISETYASPRWTIICNEAATGRDGVFVKCCREREGNSFITEWRKVNKTEYLEQMVSTAKGIATRIENYNYNKETADKRWKNLNLPGFEIKQLPAPSN